MNNIAHRRLVRRDARVWSPPFMLPVLTAFFLGAAGSYPASAQEEVFHRSVPVAPQSAVAGLRGLSFEDVIRRLGRPDSRRAADSGKESWIYGGSMVFFSQGRVDAWSDGGDFSRRSRLSSIQTSDAKRSGVPDWINEWTPNTAEAAQDEVLAEMTANAWTASAEGNKITP